MRSERGQATIEWAGVVLLVAVALAGATAVTAVLGAPGLARAIRCAVLAGCHGEDALLGRIYGPDAAAAVRAFAPSFAYEGGTLTLPVDFRSCRSHGCSDAPDARGRDVWRSHLGRRATVFTHVVDRRPGGSLYVQYWLYYPDSTYQGGAYRVSRGILARTPAGWLARQVAGHHEDDWESYAMRLDPDGSVWARASAHHGYAGRRHWPNLNEAPDLPARPRTGAWTTATGWTRVSRGSHAGHIPDGPGGERRTESDGVRLVPIESLTPDELATRFAISSPWHKPVYLDPEDTGT